MGKQTVVLALFVCFAAGFVQAVDLEISGEMKTGLYWERIEEEGQDIKEEAKIHNNDDAGTNEGRFRMNMHLLEDNIGMKVRFQQTVWTGTAYNQWAFAFAYANLLEEQIKVTVGMLGESPWSAGGPDIWQELDNQIGMRTEIKPGVLPGLNIGFVLNNWNQMVYFEDQKTLVDILSESVLGIAYTNDYVHARFSWRLDGEADVYNQQQEGMAMMYRLEARLLGLYVPDLSIFANGYWQGIGAEADDQKNYKNYLYVDYTPDAFSAELRFGLDFTGTKSHLFNAGAGFYYNILPYLSAGAAVKYNLNFGEGKALENVPFRYLRLEPQVKFSMGNFYVALVYCFDNEYFQRALQDPGMRTRHWINLRTVLTF
jgi:hypothetical protein